MRTWCPRLTSGRQPQKFEYLDINNSSSNRTTHYIHREGFLLIWRRLSGSRVHLRVRAQSVDPGWWTPSPPLFRQTKYTRGGCAHHYVVLADHWSILCLYPQIHNCDSQAPPIAPLSRRYLREVRIYPSRCTVQQHLDCRQWASETAFRQWEKERQVNILDFSPYHPPVYFSANIMIAVLNMNSPLISGRVNWLMSRIKIKVRKVPFFAVEPTTPRVRCGS